MSDLPTPTDAAEAALFAECWDAVLSYADLCTAGSPAAVRLATEAFTRGMREVRSAEAGAVRSAGRRPSRLPRIPLLLTAVRTTAASWEAGGQGHELDPDLRLWLNSDRAARHTGPPLGRPLALRGLRDMQEADAELLWLAEVEALPLPVVARRLGLDPATSAGELAQVRGLFRDRCQRNHLDRPLDAPCRGYAGLLTAVARTPGAGTPDDLSRHVAVCAVCAEAASCLRPHGAGLPAALAQGVLGWGGLAYLERRRRAADVRLGAGRPAPADTEDTDPENGSRRARVLRGGLFVAAVLVSLPALAASLMPFGGSGDDAAAPGDPTARGAVAESRPSPPATEARTPPDTSVPSAGVTESTAAQRNPDPDPEPQGTASSTAPGGATPGGATPGGAAPGTGESAPPACLVQYDLVNQWPDGFQATVTVTTARAMDSWRVAFSFRDGQRIGQIWDASHTQDGSRVTATAADYNRTVAAGESLSFGFLASWSGRNSPPDDFTLNGRGCVKNG
ncbi:hypothetical protein GCM10010129_27250 [Streptomyces fumigatiscleroticus]|nr:hypothetical protein GCM10010129_27250 [Streptomyces fumigatiscleroticus]